MSYYTRKKISSGKSGFNIKGEILWSSDFPAGRCFFTADNKLILSGDAEADYSFAEIF